MTGRLAEKMMISFVEALTRFEGFLDTQPQVNRDAARERVKLLSATTTMSFGEAMNQVQSEIINGATFTDGSKLELGVVLGNGLVFLTIDQHDIGGGEIRVAVDGLKVDNGQTLVTFNRELPVKMDSDVSEYWKETWENSPWKDKLKE
jgi:hypothetical protein